MNDAKIKVGAIIPARYASSRFPAKPLALLAGKPMIQHVYEKAAASCADVVAVATDHAAIESAVQKFGGIAVMTSESHQSGTDRIYEAMNKLGGDLDVIINVQGDEPLIPTSVIDELIAVMKEHPEIEMATVAVPGDREALANPNNVKVVFNAGHIAMYFSRSVIPYLREGGTDTPVYLHWGIYAYRRSALEKFVKLPPGHLECCEKLEQLRAMENGIGIYVVVSHLQSIGVDTPADLAKAEARLAAMAEEARK